MAGRPLKWMRPSTKESENICLEPQKYARCMSLLKWQGSIECCDGQDIVVPNGPDEQQYQLQCMLSYVSGRYCAYTCISGSWMRFDGLAAPLTIGSAWGDVMQASVDMLAVPSVLFYETKSAGEKRCIPWPPPGRSPPIFMQVIAGRHGDPQ